MERNKRSKQQVLELVNAAALLSIQAKRLALATETILANVSATDEAGDEAYELGCEQAAEQFEALTRQLAYVQSKF